MSTVPLGGQSRVDAVNVGQPRTLTVGTVEVTTSIWKSTAAPERRFAAAGRPGAYLRTAVVLTAAPRPIPSWSGPSSEPAA